ncbi:MAG: NAD(P)H:quinone oxidoreductase [Methanotrichaceae archaeon]
MKVLIVHYTLFGHTHFLAEAIEDGAGEVAGTVVEMRRVPETMSWEEIEHSGAVKFQKSFTTIPICKVDDLRGADAIFFGAPAYLGTMCAQMQQFLSSLGELWKDGSLVGKVGSAFTTSASQHGGQEAALLSMCTAMLHLGMIVVGLPYTFQGQMRIDEVSGGTPYGSTAITGQHGERKPSENELAAARFQGKHVAAIASKLAKG